MKTELALFVAKAEHYLGKVFGLSGTAMPGAIARNIDGGFFHKIATRTDVIAVTGTNGKTVTVKMIAEMMEAEGFPCFGNFSGGNVRDGAATAFIMNSDIKGNPQKKNGVIECDELWCGLLFDYMNPSVIVITNIMRDQLDRNKNPEHVKEVLTGFVKKTNSKICLNAEDELLSEMSTELSGREIYLYSEKDGTVTVNGKTFDIKLNVAGDYNRKNAAAAVAVLCAKGIVPEKSLKALESFSLPEGRMEKVKTKKTELLFNLAKNPEGIEQTLNYIRESGIMLKIVFGLNNRLTDGFDKTWIAEPNYEKYREILTDVAFYGDAKEEASRVIGPYSGTSEIIGSRRELLDTIKHSEKPVALILNYTCMQQEREWLLKKLT